MLPCLVKTVRNNTFSKFGLEAFDIMWNGNLPFDPRRNVTFVLPSDPLD